MVYIFVLLIKNKMENLQKNIDTNAFEKFWIAFKETQEQIKETSKQVQKTQEQVERTEKQLVKSDKKIKKLESFFTSQWGKFIETLIEGDLVNLLNRRGIEVQNTATRVKGKYEGRQFEIDIIAENGDDVVVVEVKSTLKVDKVKEFTDKLSQIKEMLPKYKNNNIIGAIAYLTSDEGSDKLAERSGLLVIKATGNSASIINAEDFTPKYW